MGALCLDIIRGKGSIYFYTTDIHKPYKLVSLFQTEETSKFRFVQPDGSSHIVEFTQDKEVWNLTIDGYSVGIERLGKVSGKARYKYAFNGPREVTIDRSSLYYRKLQDGES